MERFVFKKKPSKISRQIIFIFTIIWFVQIFIPVINDFLIRYFALIPNLITQGYVWQIFTYVFLHGTIYHLFWSLLFIWQLGTDVEGKIGKKNFITFMIFCVGGAGFLIFITQILFYNPNIPSIGASTITVGLMAAYIYLFPKVYVFHKKIRLGYLLFALIILSIPGAFAIAHIGAALIGYFFVRIKQIGIEI